MSRLTKKYDGGDVEVIGNEYKAFQKLSNLEDLEQDLGCPLDVVFKALKYGCHIQDEGYFECPDIYFHPLEMEFVIGWANKDNMGYELLKDYKKTWWLKEDLSE